MWRGGIVKLRDLTLGGVTVTVFAFDVAGGRIKHIWVVPNPENSVAGRWADAHLHTSRPHTAAPQQRDTFKD